MQDFKFESLSLLFIHIPRAGGTSFMDSMKKVFDDLIIVKHDTPFETVKRNAPAYAGHMRFGLHRFLSNDCRYLTLIREPGDRISSHAHHLGGGERSVDALLEQEPRLHNIATRMLSGAGDDVALGPEHVEGAIENLRNHFLFGVTERYDNFVTSLGWEVGDRLNTCENCRPVHEEIPWEAVELDFVIYDWAKENAP